MTEVSRLCTYQKNVVAKHGNLRKDVDGQVRALTTGWYQAVEGLSSGGQPESRLHEPSVDYRDGCAQDEQNNSIRKQRAAPKCLRMSSCPPEQSQGKNADCKECCCDV
jgi:hypothetical protein